MRLTEGMRVRLRRDIERFPHFIARAGLTGTVADISGGNVSVHMDMPLPGAESWDNEIVWDPELADDIADDLEVL